MTPAKVYNALSDTLDQSVLVNIAVTIANGNVKAVKPKAKLYNILTFFLILFILFIFILVNVNNNKLNNPRITVNEIKEVPNSVQFLVPNIFNGIDIATNPKAKLYNIDIVLL